MEQFDDAPVGVGAVGYEHSQCRTCGKRQSPSPSSRLGNSCDAEIELRSKKPMIHNPNYNSLLGCDAGLNGYEEIKLRIDLDAAVNLKASSESPLLRRCVSDPYNSPGDGNKNNAGGDGLEPDGVLRRNVSDPYQPPGVTPKNQAGAGVGVSSSPAKGMSPGGGGGLPPLYPGTNRMSNDVVTPIKGPTECLTGQSPDSLRLKRIKEKVKEMARLWVDVVSEDDETPDGEEQNAAAAAGTDSQDVDDKEHEEQIGVEKVGDGLKIKLRCPCGSSYELLITGHCCYYKIL